MNEELDLGNGSPVTGLVRKLKRQPPRLVTTAGPRVGARRSGFDPSGPNLSVTIGVWTDVWDLTPCVLSWIRLKVAVIISSGCMAPNVRSLDGVARALLCVKLKPCRLHVHAPKTSELPDLQKRRDERGDGINCT